MLGFGSMGSGDDPNDNNNNDNNNNNNNRKPRDGYVYHFNPNVYDMQEEDSNSSCGQAWNKFVECIQYNDASTTPEEHEQEPLPNLIHQVPDAPVKTQPFKKIKRGLPKPFEPRQGPRRILFDLIQAVDLALLSPVPPCPPCPRRKSLRRAESRLNRTKGKLSKRRLFDERGDEEESCSHEESPSCGNATPNQSLLNAPKKKRIAEDESQEVEEEEEDMDVEENVEVECPSAPANSPVTPVENAMEVVSDDRFTRISTPQSAPLPTNYDSPRVPRTRRRRSDGTLCFSKKRLRF